MRGQGVLRARESKGKLARRWLLKMAFIAMSSAGKEEKRGLRQTNRRERRSSRVGNQSLAQHCSWLHRVTDSTTSSFSAVCVGPKACKDILVRDGIARKSSVSCASGLTGHC